MPEDTFIIGVSVWFVIGACMVIFLIIRNKKKMIGKRRGLRYEIRLWLVSVLICWVINILPTNAHEWWIWLSKMPEPNANE